MDNNQLLDDGFKPTPITFPSGLRRWRWHLKFATIVIGYHLFVLFLLFFVLPFFPKSIKGSISVLLGVGILLVLLGVTIYVCKVGYQWNWIAALIGGSLLFFCSFIYVMIHLKSWVTICTPWLNTWLDLSPRQLKDILDIMLVGLPYNIISILVIESLAILNLIWKQFRSITSSSNS